MAITNNPSGRLYDILREVRSKPDNIQMRQVWGDIFGVDVEDTNQLLYYVWQMAELLRSAKLAVQRLENVDLSLYLTPFANIEKAFSALTFEQMAGHFKSRLTPETMMGLQFCADALSRAGLEDEIDAESLGELLSDVEQMIEEVTAAPFDATLKLVLLQNLEEVRRAIRDYRLRGAAGLKQAVEASIGAVIRNSSAIKTAAENPTIKPTAGRFLQLINRANQIVSFGSRLKHLAEPVFEQLQQLMLLP